MHILQKNDEIMKTSSLVHLMITVCMIYGCSDNSPKSILTDIDSFIQERPDSALAILDTMDRASLKTERLKAHHALLHAMALDKNFIDVSNDSIARVAVDYYATRGSRKSYARSLYYLGLAYFYQEEYTKAIVEFTKAESVAVTSDSLYLGFSKVGLADTYGKSYNYGEEENNLKEAFDIFSSLSLNYYSQATLLRLANVYFNTSQTEKSIEILNELIIDNNIADNLKSSALATLAYQYTVKESPNLIYAETLFRRNNEEYGGNNMSIKRYWAWAYSLYATGRKSEAREIMSQLISDESVTSSYWQYLITKSDGNLLLSLKHLENYIKYNDIIVSDIIHQSVALSQRDYYEYLADNYEYKAHNTRLTMLITILTFIFSSLLVFVLVRMYVKKQEFVKEKNLLYISEIRRQLEEAKREDYPLLKKKYLSLYRRKFEMIGTLYEHLMNSKDLINIEESIYKKVDALVINFTQDYKDSKKFEAMLDEDLDNIMSNLRSEVPDLKPKDYSIFSLFVIGFDVTTISHLLNTTMNTIYIRKSRIKHHIEELNPPHKTQFLDALS